AGGGASRFSPSVFLLGDRGAVLGGRVALVGGVAVVDGREGARLAFCGVQAGRYECFRLGGGFAAECRVVDASVVGVQDRFERLAEPRVLSLKGGHAVAAAFEGGRVGGVVA